MEKIEKFRLLAEFEGGELYKNEHYEFNGCELYRVDKMPYDSDWNWLMRICNIIHGHGMTVYIAIGGYAQITGEDLPHIIEVTADTSIEAAFEACVEFVKWWNGITKP